ncbi:MAG: hypothetical protein JWN95_1160 [Frankiales bacterium]|nr:hypothetical protein [Frankiales bacterium]
MSRSRRANQDEVNSLLTGGSAQLRSTLEALREQPDELSQRAGLNAALTAYSTPDGLSEAGRRVHRLQRKTRTAIAAALIATVLGISGAAVAASTGHLDLPPLPNLQHQQVPVRKPSAPPPRHTSTAPSHQVSSGPPALSSSATRSPSATATMSATPPVSAPATSITQSPGTTSTSSGSSSPSPGASLSDSPTPTISGSPAKPDPSSNLGSRDDDEQDNGNAQEKGNAQEEGAGRPTPISVHSAGKAAGNGRGNERSNTHRNPTVAG